MLSFSKIIFTVLVVVVVWQGFKLFNRFKQVSENEQSKQTRAQKKSQPKTVHRKWKNAPSAAFTMPKDPHTVVTVRSRA